MKTISVEALKAKIDAGEKINLVDVREPHEHEAYNIGGILLPLGKVQALETDDVDHLKNETVYVYCRSGNRSGMAVSILGQNGVNEVYNGGGIHDMLQIANN